MYNKTYTITGNTYNNKDMIKDLGARWNAAAKAWIVVGSLLDSTVWTLRRAGCRVTVS
jgi:hypothetical protein